MDMEYLEREHEALRRVLRQAPNVQPYLCGARPTFSLKHETSWLLPALLTELSSIVLHRRPRSTSTNDTV